VTLRPLLNALLYFPSRTIAATPADAGLTHRDVELTTDDGQRLHGWWIERRAPARGHVLLCHGNAGNVGDRVAHAAVLSAAGFDVLLSTLAATAPAPAGPTRRAPTAMRAPPAAGS
jgi:alpha-beta hydrolase superfamily lysophospholipase